MSAIIVAGNEIIPDTLTVTVDGTEITAKDFQKVLLNINQASATASVADGTDLMQKMEIINKNANACDVSFKGEGGATVKNLKQNQSMRMTWTGSYWYVTFGGLLSGVANDGTSFNYTTEVTLDEAPVNTVYSTTEQDTGMTWIDGKKIYRQVFKSTVTTYTDDGSKRTFVPAYTVADIGEFISITGGFIPNNGAEYNSFRTYGTATIYSDRTVGYTSGVTTNNTSGRVYPFVVMNTTYATTSVTFLAIVLFTKTTD